MVETQQVHERVNKQCIQRLSTFLYFSASGDIAFSDRSAFTGFLPNKFLHGSNASLSVKHCTSTPVTLPSSLPCHSKISVSSSTLSTEEAPRIAQTFIECLP